jgi:hypothetical protein
MHRMLLLLTSLMLALSLGLGSVAHASEPIGCATTGTEVSAGHSDGDSDQVPADGDSGFPHHHGGCHGHHVAAPVADADSAGHARAASIPALAEYRGGVTSPTDPALRPPQA